VVQRHVNELRQSIYNLRLIIENIGEHPEEIDDVDFRRKLTIVNITVVRLWEDAKRLSGARQIEPNATHGCRIFPTSCRQPLAKSSPNVAEFLFVICSPKVAQKPKTWRQVEHCRLRLEFM